MAAEAPASQPRAPAAPADAAKAAAGSPAGEGTRFRVDKPGFHTDVFDRRGMRNLIRTGEVLQTDLVRVDDFAPLPASELPHLKSLFSLAEAQASRPPLCCRTHSQKVAFFRCHDSGRPLCEDCAPEKKFGGTTIRVCLHCGGTAEDLVPA